MQLPSQQTKVATYFHHRSPACGRALRVLVELLGTRVLCHHCGKISTAQTPTGDERQPDGSRSLLERANDLLEHLEASPRR